MTLSRRLRWLFLTVGVPMMCGIVMGVAIVLATSAHAWTFYPTGNRGDHSIGEVRYDVSTVNSRYAMSMPDDMPQTTCQALGRGASEASLESMGESSGIPHDVVRVVVFSSEFHFCPEYY